MIDKFLTHQLPAVDISAMVVQAVDDEGDVQLGAYAMRLGLGLIVTLVSLFALSAYSQEIKEFTADALIAKNIEARGGIDAMRAVKSLKFEGKMLVNQGQIEFAFSQTKRQPGEVRTDLTLQGMTLVQAYDGKEGWKISPFSGRKDPEKMSTDEAKSLVEDAEIEGPLVDWKAKGSTVEYLGPEDVDGTLAHKLKVVKKKRTEQGAKVEVETDLGDYEKVGGVYFPFSIEAAPKGVTDKQKIVIEKADANVTNDDAQFKFPTSPSK